MGGTLQVNDVVAVGDRLFVKVVGLGDADDPNPKIALSIKTVCTLPQTMTHFVGTENV
jgi:predicted RNA-binding protein with RPS1 domain